MSPRFDYSKPREPEPRATKEVTKPLNSKQLAIASKMRKEANHLARKSEIAKRKSSKASELQVAKKKLKNRKRRLAKKLRDRKTKNHIADGFSPVRE